MGGAGAGGRNGRWRRDGGLERRGRPLLVVLLLWVRLRVGLWVRLLLLLLLLLTAALGGE